MMTARSIAFFLAVSMVGAAAPAWALTGQEILVKMDAAEFSAKDSAATVKVQLLEKGQVQSERKMQMFQMGAGKRLVRFLEPADVKGIAFLDEGEDKMYVYMPAFHKVRRIAGHVKNEDFAGTDFSYDDLKAGEFSKRMDAGAVTEDPEHYIVEAKSKPSEESQYGKVVLQVRKKDFLIDKIDFFDQNQKLWKVLVREDFKPAGAYTQSYKFEMRNEKSGHATRMIVEELKTDTGLKDSFFSQRQLKR
jgi:outer membrane lipoprotein-sorting protein